MNKASEELGQMDYAICFLASGNQVFIKVSNSQKNEVRCDDR